MTKRRLPFPLSSWVRTGRAVARGTVGLVVLAAVTAALPILAQEAPADAPELAFAPLFRSHDLLRLRIEADFHQIRRDRDEDSEERPGQLFLLKDDGSEEAFPVQVKTRGRFRLQSNTCGFPPIRVNFAVSGVEGSVFEGQDKVKLVTHCRDSERYEQNVVKEYLVYRIYNTLTPLGLQARMARVTYVDTSGEDEPIERLAFFIEMEEAMAERAGGTIMSDEEQARGVHPSKIFTAEAYRVALFQYMVGNTDFSMYGNFDPRNAVPPHNSIPVLRDAGGILPVPYDFDWTGLVNAPYAKPDPSLPTRTVRQRVFRGLCRPAVNWDALYTSFQTKREEITALIRDEALLTENTREEVLDYLDDFWKVLDSERNRRREIEEGCRPL